MATSGGAQAHPAEETPDGEWVRITGLMVLVAIAYAAGSMVSYTLINLSSAGAVFFPAAGVSLAALTLSPTSRWPAILATVAVTEFVIDTVQGHPVPAALGFALANSVEPLVGAALLRRASGDDLDLGRRRHLRNFVVFAVVMGPLVGGLIGGTTIALAYNTGWWVSVLPFWAGDAMGVLTLGAAIWAGRQWRQAAPVAALAFVGTAAITALSFWPTVPLAYLSMLPLLWLAFNVSIAALAAAGLGMTLAANVMTSLGYGPWAALADRPNIEVATLQLFLAIALLSAWLLAVGLRERKFASRRYQEERSSALQLQRALLPQIPDSVSGVVVGALYRPGDEHHAVGGDWYDVFAVRPHRVALVVGDIVGHDLPAAAAMGRTYPVVRLLAGQMDAPGEVLDLLDAACGVLPEASFSTVGYAEFTPSTATLRYSCAGHPPPLLIDDTGARFLWEGRAAPVGVPTGPRPTATMALERPSRLVWFTDGLIERAGTPLTQSLDALLVIAGGLSLADSPEEWCQQLLAALTQGQLDLGEAIADDIVVLCADLRV